MTPEFDPGRVGSHADPDTCIDLIENLIPPAERERVLAHLAVCPSCEDLLRRQAATRERLRAEAPEALRHEPRRHHGPGAHPRGRTSTATIGRFFAPAASGRGIALAGALAAVALVVVVARTPRVEGPAARTTAAPPQVHWLPGSETEVITRAPWTAAPDPNVRAGVEAYARHDLAEARRLLGSSRSEGSLEVMRQLFLGSAAALDRDFAAAEDLLARLPMEQVPEPWRGEALWTLYAVFESRGARTRADSLLTLIAASPGPIAERARTHARR